MTKVKNLNGTDDNAPDSKGYPTWRAFWEAKTGRSFSDCSCDECKSSATVGAHVQKADSADRKWYIVPLCSSCNVSRKNEVFEVRDNDLVAVNS